MDDNSKYSLDDLAELTGLTTRSIRHYIQQGLLSGAESRGRNAWYTEEHLNRLRCLQILRDRSGLSLSELRPVINALSEEQIRSIAAGEEEVMALPIGQAGTSMHSDNRHIGTSHRLADESNLVSEPRFSRAPSMEQEVKETTGNEALDYIRKIRGGKKDDVSRLAATVQSIEKLTGGRRIPRKASNEWWATVKITPDIEIRARGMDEKDVGELERLADLMRHLLMKGDSYDK